MTPRDHGGERLGAGRPRRRGARRVERARAQERLGRAARVALLVAHQAQVVLRVGALRVGLRGLLDERRGLVDLAELVPGAPDEKEVARAVERAVGEHLHRALRFLVVRLGHQRIHFEEDAVGDLFVRLGVVERVFDLDDGAVVVAQGRDQHLGRVEHRLEVRLVERDRLAIVLERLVGVALEGGREAHQVVHLGRLRIDLERALGARARAGGVAFLGEVPAAVEVGGELILH